jgi:hypothetical protein
MVRGLHPLNPTDAEMLEHLDDKQPVKVLLVFDCGCMASVPFNYDHDTTATEPILSQRSTRRAVRQGQGSVGPSAARRGLDADGRSRMI